MTKKRALANPPGSDVGKQRYGLFAAGIDRIQDAIKAGFYLEAITLCESFIADRLESRLKFLLGNDKYSFEPLGKLQIGIKNHETDSELKSIVATELDAWRKERNDALHAIVKIKQGDTSEWEDRMKNCKNIAKIGEGLRKKIFKKVRKLRSQ